MTPNNVMPRETHEVEYSKVWATCHPELFATDFLLFLSRHPDDLWRLAFQQRVGSFTIQASSK